jgi:DNA-binding protein Alba
MNYVTACMTCLNNRKNEGRVVIAARGRVISKAVDVVEFLKRFVQIEVEDVRIGTEQVGYEGEKRNISTIEIYCRR